MNIFDQAKQKTRELKKRIDSLKKGPCQDCGENFPNYVLQFYMVNEDLVVNPNISDRNLKEITDCDLICANCAKVRMHNQKRNRKEK